MKKIIILGTTGYSMTNFRLSLIKDLIASNFEVYCLANDFNAEQMNILNEIGAIPVHYPINRSGFNPFQDVINTFHLYKIIKKTNADIILSYFVKPVIYGTISAFFAKVPKRFAMIEGLGYFFTEQPQGSSTKSSIIKKIQVMLYKISLPLSQGTIFLNHDDEKDLLQTYKISVPKTLIIPGIGLNTSEYPYNPLSSPGSPLSFLFIGRLLNEKGINEFIDAAKIIKNKYPNIIFKIAGSIDVNNPGSITENQLDTLTKANTIQFLGQVNNIQDVISQSDVFVLPSYREGMPRSTQEAMSIGRAVITTDAPGCRESIIHKEHGFIIPKWSVSELVNAIEFFIKNPDVTIDMGKQAHLYAKSNYDSKITNNIIINFMKN
ncbi:MULTISPECIES: glycosyltransferase family 4 protein [Vitreoscilla]|uniref:Glycosyltransferase family 4 protein n=1 Tax=Vitreoscilla stercoraria TaxID=61 RepID=A0ABY4E8K6_VITST|nr:MULTISPECIES: glycosyltransferase family 4 protein [Vitreoscilla]AUZ04140.2 hypothetical protein ADP71_03290 [Vitreoscilla sp. C1]UOO92093.1 glycosyltransferase family 4 protein [Vitreoscilla stercoraria]